ncbi:fasciclin domain-containing protein [Pedobacter nutrimenti]|uniref:Fasciclin domain-containing protein n=1 Tax=Pedobacter nutrimenti TaxID=1241337 RepID=A0A318UFQ0_9SPHI|nr:fasciclin domain-containing protein [Pedobacter nutrimenti]PYF75206.1 fasciclin domain-containing protein [Pedobacter nutrimenti]
MNIKKTGNTLLFLLPILLVLGLSSCKHTDLEIDKPNENFRPAGDFVKNNYDLSLFSAAMEKAGFTQKLNGTGPFTILAPSNEAFNLIGITRPSDFDKMNPDSLKFLVGSHILDRRLLSQDIPVNGIDIRYHTLAETEVYTSVFSGAEDPMIFFNGSYVSRLNVKIANGNLFVLKRVMKSSAKTTVQSWLAARPQYSIFVSALKKFGYWDELTSEGPYTIFAPKNEVFEANGLTAEVIAGLKPDRYIRSRLVGCYVFRKKHFFVSDFYVLTQINNDGGYGGFIEDDTYFMTIGANAGLYYKGNSSYSIYVRTAKNYPYDPVGSAGCDVPAGIDNLTDNGIVQDLKGLLVLPEQAYKNN